eukprot:TRINITY_DN21678_c0_g3_i1.p1 TRINITY_DN21678_c0_g3~~TRINITY_DN21678_c0_g3_i1.p1  ORF type:complete len:222 (+),score=60.29 TRINITY_DN21678_c0_g3_i1:66-731(+)
MVSFLCCCAPTETEAKEAAVVHIIPQEGTADFRRSTDHMKLLGREKALALEQRSLVAGSYGGGGSTPRSGGGFTPRDVVKAKLQEAMRDFKASVLRGMPVLVVDAPSQQASEGLFLMDRSLRSLTLRLPSEEERSFALVSVTAVFKGKELAARLPDHSSLAERCVVVEFQAVKERICFQFQDDAEKDHFYKCMKILRLSADFVPVEPVAAGPVVDGQSGGI